jgi:hypothetical protein
MRRSNWTPSIVPNGDDRTVYLVVDDYAGRDRRHYVAELRKAEDAFAMADPTPRCASRKARHALNI